MPCQLINCVAENVANLARQDEAAELQTAAARTGYIYPVSGDALTIHQHGTEADIDGRHAQLAAICHRRPALAAGQTEAPRAQ